jgi:hypothetical protein
MLQYLKLRKEKMLIMINSNIIISKKINLLDVSNMCDYINTLGNGASIVPVITIHTLLTLIQPFILLNITILPLKEHTSTDCKSYGDIVCVDNMAKPIIVIEIKHKIPITDTLILIFNKKTNIVNTIILKFIITTANTLKKVTTDNICIDTLKNFILSYIQQSLFHNTNICLLFIQELRNNILKYHNLNITIKEQINSYIKEMLV